MSIANPVKVPGSDIQNISGINVIKSTNAVRETRNNIQAVVLLFLTSVIILKF